MRKHYFLGIIIFVVVTFFSVNVFGKGDVRRGEPKYKVCAACHGAKGEGNEALNAPAIAGQQDWYLARQLYNFKNGIRGSDPNDNYGQQMRPMAMALADEDAINNIAAFISTLK